jgi:hypothetical protein
MWDQPSCEGLLYSCCIDVVNLTFFLQNTLFYQKLIIILIWLILCTKNNVALSLTIISLNLLSNLQKNKTTNNKKLKKNEKY